MNYRIVTKLITRVLASKNLTAQRVPVRSFYSSKTLGNERSSKENDSDNGSFKKFYQNPLFKPLVILCFFGSQVLNVINIKKEYKEMENNYQIKINTLKQMIGIVSDPSEATTDQSKYKLRELKERLDLIDQRISNNELLKKGDYEELEKNFEGKKKRKSIVEIIDEDINDLIVSNFREEYDPGSEEKENMDEFASKQDIKKEEPKPVAETIIIEDKLGAVEDVAKTRKVSKFL